jgi:hypothetical protein
MGAGRSARDGLGVTVGRNDDGEVTMERAVFVYTT